MDLYGNREEIRKIYDEDSEKQGKRIKEKYIIEKFSKETSEGIDFIFVMSSSYFKEVAEKAHAIKRELKIFDIQSYLEAYLSFPVAIDECIL